MMYLILKTVYLDQGDKIQCRFEKKNSIKVRRIISSCMAKKWDFQTRMILIQMTRFEQQTIGDYSLMQRKKII